MRVGYAAETGKEVNGRKRCMHSPLTTHYNVVRGRQGDRVYKTAQAAARKVHRDKLQGFMEGRETNSLSHKH